MNNSNGRQAVDGANISMSAIIVKIIANKIDEKIIFVRNKKRIIKQSKVGKNFNSVSREKKC